ncbi:DEAD/DEAH box helicase, partial [Burkholderia pseudomallei]
ALRAAFIAVMAGKQVALHSPTTQLAEKHTQTFADPFADWPVRNDELSRFKTAYVVYAAFGQIYEGSVDIVIGTHKLLSSDLQFKRLGLLIIDEEHRLGVRKKEALKALRAE